MRLYILPPVVLAVFLAFGLLATVHANASPVTVATFVSPVLPTGLTITKHGDIYLSMAVTGEVRKLTPNGQQSTVTTFNTGFSTGFGFLGALAVDDDGDVYAALVSFNSPGSDTHGVWRIRQNGTKQLVAAFPNNSFPHNLAFDKKGNLFVTDAFLSKIWRISNNGQIGTWAQHPLFQPDPNACPPVEAPFNEGLGGIAFDKKGDMYLTNLNKALILRVPVGHDGAAGVPTIFAGPDCARLDGIDGIALDVHENVYVANENKHTVLRVSQSKVITTLVTPAAGTDSPHAVAFGTKGNDKKTLYFANFAGLTFLAGGNPKPSLMKIDVGVKGLAVPPGGGDDHDEDDHDD